ncbi:hypothetical protein Halru_1085 [Halovivax ruber XH-70]|uniref:Blue (type 1) copper domain-containing protein n=1 Tax=Halovivax ruber (strain DSM 18193 / JCM 13892 / XH-70) TaxID=797302 RepID=L0ICL1_HALRX|nr:plastocyanin/azurin family copper-binding protein [Halovivax ruber]AGB15702.1 hypothetical protein Halru_1085 [Halovivax ruber XH-70]
MKRRTALTGVTGAIGVGLAGCLTDIGDDTEPETDGSTESDPCESGRKLIEAIADEEYEQAAEYAPIEFDSSQRLSAIGELYKRAELPSIEQIECAGTTDETIREYDRELDADVADAASVEYALTTSIADESVDLTVEVTAIEIDGEWYTWISDGLVTQVNPDVRTEGNGTNAVTITFADRGAAKRIYVQGESIESPTDYQLIREEESLTLSTDEVGAGRFDVVGEGWNGQTEVVSQFSLGRRESWADVEEIVFRAMTTSWVGKQPAHIAGVDNPTLILERGREYRIGWDEGNGAGHNLELRNADDEVVDDYATEVTMEPDESQILTVTATDELATYRCVPHSGMEGEIEVVDEL